MGRREAHRNTAPGTRVHVSQRRGTGQPQTDHAYRLGWQMVKCTHQAEDDSCLAIQSLGKQPLLATPHEGSKKEAQVQ